MSIKPTPGPWVARFNAAARPKQGVYTESHAGGLIADCWSLLEHRQADAELMAEAGNVYHETGLTPRQLLEQRDELLKALRVAQNALARCARPTDDDLKMSSRDAWILCVEAEKEARAALAKCGGV